MNMEKVKAIFLEMTGKPEITPYLLYIESAAENVGSLIKPEFSENVPECVHAYTAAMAARMLTYRDCSSEKLVCTEAGSVPSQRDTSDRRESAEMQMSLLKAMCAPYLTDQEFVMRSIGKEPDSNADALSDKSESSS